MKKVVYLTLASLIAFYAGQASAKVPGGGSGNVDWSSTNKKDCSINLNGSRHDKCTTPNRAICSQRDALVAKTLKRTSPKDAKRIR